MIHLSWGMTYPNFRHGCCACLQWKPFANAVIMSLNFGWWWFGIHETRSLLCISRTVSLFMPRASSWHGSILHGGINGSLPEVWNNDEQTDQIRFLSLITSETKTKFPAEAWARQMRVLIRISKTLESWENNWRQHLRHAITIPSVTNRCFAAIEKSSESHRRTAIKLEFRHLNRLLCRSRNSILHCFSCDAMDSVAISLQFMYVDYLETNSRLLSILFGCRCRHLANEISLLRKFEKENKRVVIGRRGSLVANRSNAISIVIAQYIESAHLLPVSQINIMSINMRVRAAHAKINIYLRH